MIRSFSVHRYGCAAAIVLAAMTFASSPAAAELVAFKFDRTVSLTAIGGPSDSHVVFTMIYDTTQAGTPLGAGHEYAITGGVSFDGQAATPVSGRVILTETVSIDAVSVQFFLDDPVGGNETVNDGLPFNVDLNKVSLSWGDSSRNMLSGTTSLPTDFTDPSFDGHAWSIQLDWYGPGLGILGANFGVTTISPPQGDPGTHWESAATPSPASLSAAVMGVALLARRRPRRGR